jgi:hypothetical protein
MPGARIISVRQVYHQNLIGLALSLLVLRVLTDDHDFAMSLDNLALIADRLY